jgi:hypothetical protein
MAVLGGLLALALAALAFQWIAGRSRRPATAGQPGTAAIEEAHDSEVVLYFPGPGGVLVAESRPLSTELEGAERVERILEEILLGPTTEDLYPSLAADTAVTGVLVAPDGTAFVDLGSAERASPSPCGSREELLRVFSLVNSILLNEPEISAVVLLWNGRQLTTFAGHVDTARPLRARPGLIAESS